MYLCKYAYPYACIIILCVCRHVYEWSCLCIIYYCGGYVCFMYVIFLFLHYTLVFHELGDDLYVIKIVCEGGGICYKKRIYITNFKYCILILNSIWKYFALIMVYAKSNTSAFVCFCEQMLRIKYIFLLYYLGEWIWIWLSNILLSVLCN